MNKINFINNSSPDLSSENLNQMQDNMEEVGVVVSATEPTTGENVWIQKGKNLFNKDNGSMFLQGLFPDNNGLITAGATDITSSNYQRTIILPIEGGETYTISRNVAGKTFYVYEAEKYPNQGYTVTSLKTNTDTTAINETVTTSSNAKYLLVKIYNSWNAEPSTYNDLISSVQIEQGSTATEYEAYVEKAIYVKNSNGVYEKFYDENEDTGWINGTLESGIILSSNAGFKYGNGIQARIKNGVLYVRISVSKTTGNFSPSDGEVIIGEMPVINKYDFAQIFKDTFGNMARGSIFGAGTVTGFLQIKGNVIQVRLTNDQAANWIVGMVAIPLN